MAKDAQRCARRLRVQPTNRPAHQPISPSAHQPISPSAHQPISPSAADRQPSGRFGFPRFGSWRGGLFRREASASVDGAGASCAVASCSGSLPARRICCSASLRPPATSPWYRAGHRPFPAAMLPAVIQHLCQIRHFVVSVGLFLLAKDIFLTFADHYIFNFNRHVAAS